MPYVFLLSCSCLYDLSVETAEMLTRNVYYVGTLWHVTLIVTRSRCAKVAVRIDVLLRVQTPEDVGSIVHYIGWSY